MEFTIRPARPDDFQSLPDIERAADELLEMPGLPAASSPEEYQASLQTLVAEADGRIFGLARIEEIDGEAHLEQLSVLPPAAGQGLGRFLLETAKAWAARAGYQEMTLCTFRDVSFNAPFYSTAGFVTLEDFSAGLAALRQRETELGLDALGARVVMVAAL
ncbi:GNAT family N-acetyltransferase [Psychromicrobium lacuslunae]|uniref:N-acetyltransferase domain-containing protein n=1 Tax=Psychromicrobium lacuslunae TaxID=1618207 RepID=A0A0D4BY12_9MICC|nr:GNAT family N-acetyltransferase [Psychromicrobium lacuslunae]AJT41223.1 hypothetical protein UM93_06275 [Psychromicrobium lacuslunae]